MKGLESIVLYKVSRPLSIVWSGSHPDSFENY